LGRSVPATAKVLLEGYEVEKHVGKSLVVLPWRRQFATEGLEKWQSARATDVAEALEWEASAGLAFEPAQTLAQIYAVSSAWPAEQPQNQEQGASTCDPIAGHGCSDGVKVQFAGYNVDEQFCRRAGTLLLSALTVSVASALSASMDRARRLLGRHHVLVASKGATEPRKLGVIEERRGRHGPAL